MGRGCPEALVGNSVTVKAARFIKFQKAPLTVGGNNTVRGDERWEKNQAVCI